MTDAATRHVTPKLGGYVVLTALGLLAALIFARPELALIAVPFAVTLAVGLSLARQPDVRVHVEIDRARVLADYHALVNSCARPHKKSPSFLEVEKRIGRRFASAVGNERTCCAAA